MPYVLVLTADPAGTPLDNSTVDIARAALAQTGARPADPAWLAPQLACEIAFSGTDDSTAVAAVRAAITPAPIDANAIPVAGRRKRLLLADMESTLIENEMLDDLAAAIGAGPAVAEITRRAMNGEIDFRDALRERVGLLAGLPVERLEEAARGIRAMPGAATLVATMRAHGAYTAIVSGGFLFFTGLVRKCLGADQDEGNDLEIVGGTLTGKVREPILNRDGKVNALRRVSAERGFSPADAIAVGDGANDLPMLMAAGMGVAFRAKPVVAASAPLRVDHGDLTALLYLQGYRREAFAGPKNG
jgi:phosphoserine phosphatase